MNKIFSIAFVLILTFGFGAYAQKIKVKKGRIFLDKENIACIEKVKEQTDSIKDKYFKISDKNGNHKISFRRKYLNSPLYHCDKYYRFYTMEAVGIPKKIGINKKGFNLREKNMTAYLIENKLLTATGFNKKNIETFIINKEVLPHPIAEHYNKEIALLEFINFKADRLLTKPVIVKFYKTTTGKGTLVPHYVTKSRFDIFQDAVLIGYAVAEEIMMGIEKNDWLVNPPTNYRPAINSDFELLIYNLENVPLASYRGLSYKTYNPYKEFGSTKNDVDKIESIIGRIKYITHDLIDKSML